MSKNMIQDSSRLLFRTHQKRDSKLPDFFMKLFYWWKNKFSVPNATRNLPLGEGI